jgi:hypothetical protein
MTSKYTKDGGVERWKEPGLVELSKVPLLFE